MRLLLVSVALLLAVAVVTSARAQSVYPGPNAVQLSATAAADGSLSVSVDPSADPMDEIELYLPAGGALPAGSVTLLAAINGDASESIVVNGGVPGAAFVACRDNADCVTLTFDDSGSATYTFPPLGGDTGDSGLVLPGARTAA